MRQSPIKRSLSAVLLTLGMLPLLGVAVGRAQDGGRSIWDGIYTSDQAKRGLAVYTERCALCHMDSLDGGGVASALVGDDFMADWKGKSVGDLFRRTMATMPADDPGNLAPAQMADTLAYIFSKNKFPTGAAEMPSDSNALKLIRIQPEK